MTKIERDRKYMLLVLSRYGVIDDDYSKQNIIDLENGNNGFWGLLNKALYVNKKDHKALSEIFYIRASQAFKEGGNPYVALYLAGQHLIKSYEELNIKVTVTVITSKNSLCSNCRHLDGVILTVGEAKKLNLIPHDPCVNGYCSAAYAAIAQRDKDGFVQMNNQ